MAGWFFPYYVAAARGQSAAARTPGQRWEVLRTICADLAGLRRSDHYVERLRIWQEKLQLESKGVTEQDFVKYARAHPDIKKLIWPEQKPLTPEEKERCVKQIYWESPIWTKVTRHAMTLPAQWSRRPTSPGKTMQMRQKMGEKIALNRT